MPYLQKIVLLFRKIRLVVTTWEKVCSSLLNVCMLKHVFVLGQAWATYSQLAFTYCTVIYIVVVFDSGFIQLNVEQWIHVPSNKKGRFSFHSKCFFFLRLLRHNGTFLKVCYISGHPVITFVVSIFITLVVDISYITENTGTSIDCNR